MSDYSVNVPSADYKKLVRKAIAFDMVCEVTKHLKPYQWDDVLNILCHSIAPEKFADVVDGDCLSNESPQTAE